ncbi:hypothetical protein Lbys_3613 [Leadbetterella byssophila DSM 17132]|uniref:Transmembrane protein n=1 Tax=Leadbetterella byssophila (strain DSM 17132 / JCM 16389 / KACC 11308 / NBRC 106382 / 4M15) TaxID=649349 RepID=E4RZW9_LEAB4|nr:hypothetical protein Lbys_3613 [Leadbetterella byssophila DSM 17132]
MKALQNYVPSILLFVVLFLVQRTSWAEYLPERVWYIFLFFVALDILVQKLTKMGFEQENFINFYLASVVIRMVLILIFVGVFLYMYPENRKAILLTTVVFYLFFTTFEISFLLRKLRRF